MHQHQHLIRVCFVAGVVALLLCAGVQADQDEGDSHLTAAERVLARTRAKLDELTHGHSTEDSAHQPTATAPAAPAAGTDEAAPAEDAEEVAPPQAATRRGSEAETGEADAEEAQAGEDEDEDEDGEEEEIIGNQRPFTQPSSRKPMAASAQWAYKIVSAEWQEDGGDGILRPAHFHRYINMVVCLAPSIMCQMLALARPRAAVVCVTSAHVSRVMPRALSLTLLPVYPSPHRFVSLTLNPSSVPLTTYQQRLFDERINDYITKLTADNEEMPLHLGLLARGSPLRWLIETNKYMQRYQISADAAEPEL